MKIKWKKPNTLKPDVILKRIEAVRTVSPSGQISFSGFELHDALPALRSMIDIPGPHTDYEPARLIWKAISRLKTPLTADAVIDEINAVRKEESATTEVVYKVLTSLSLASAKFVQATQIRATTVRLVGSEFPKPFRSSRKILVENASLPVPNEAKDYCVVVLTLKAKNPKQAVRRALRDLDVLRGVWCLLGNHRMEIIGQEWQPINRIRLGPVHTVHLAGGKSAADEVWFEPSHSPAKAFKPDGEHFKRHATYILRSLHKSRYQDVLCEALSRYVQALDESNQSTALVKLWSSLELMALGPIGPADYELMVRRVASIFVPGERDYHHQILQHLRESRNQSIHAGTDSESKTLCFQVQFYFFHMFLFLLNHKEVRSLKEAHDFLDLPAEIGALERRLRLIRSAKRFRSTPP